MIQLFPEQLQALQNTLDGTAARAAAVLGVEIDRVEQFLDNVAEFVRVNAGPLSNYTYLFLFDGSTSDGSRIDLQTITKNVNVCNSLFHVDEELHLIQVAKGDATITQCSKHTKEKQALGLRLEGTYFWEFLSGIAEGQDDFGHPGTAEPKMSKWRRPMTEFDQILADHKKARIDKEAFVYWHDRANRILVDKTEEVFHRDLFWWLDNYVIDKLDAYAEPSGFGQGKTDIVVVTLYGSHVLELKWLGRNQKDTRYDEQDIDPGLVQIATYLENDDDLICGYLVIYDGRSREKHENHCHYKETLRHNRCRSPRIVFLKSEYPSERGRRIARERQTAK